MTRALTFVAPAILMVALSACVPSPYLSDLPGLSTQPGAVGVPATTPAVATPEMLASVIPAAAAPRDRLIAAMEQNGCVLDASNRDAVMMRANIAVHDLVNLTRQLASEGMVEVAASGTIRVLTPNCI